MSDQYKTYDNKDLVGELKFVTAEWYIAKSNLERLEKQLTSLHREVERRLTEAEDE